jgi:hypothetical protein
LIAIKCPQQNCAVVIPAHRHGGAVDLPHRHHPDVVLLLYGLRRGEVLADEQGAELRIRQHIQRVHGQLQIGPVKSAAGRRDLPLLSPAADVLEIRRTVQRADRAEMGRAWQDTGLIFTTRTGRPIAPRNLGFEPQTSCMPLTHTKSLTSPITW